MGSQITQDTKELWWDNIRYIIENTKEAEKASEEILNYLEGEGAFEVVKDN